MNIKDLTLGDTVEYLHAYTQSGKKIGLDDAKFGTGKFVSIDGTQIVLEDSTGDKFKISEHWIRWDRTEHYKNQVKLIDKPEKYFMSDETLDIWIEHSGTNTYNGCPIEIDNSVPYGAVCADCF